MGASRRFTWVRTRATSCVKVRAAFVTSFTAIHLRYTGVPRATKRPMIARTASISTRVNPAPVRFTAAASSGHL